jgi:uncharacterized protein YggE
MQPRSILLLTFFIGFVSSTAVAQTTETVPSLVIVGEAEQTGTPDVALLTVGVTQDRDTAGQALRATTQAVRSALEVVLKHGVESRDIQTSGLSVQPRYGRLTQRSGDDDRVVVIGYSASNQLTLRVRGIERIGELLDNVVAAGLNEIRGLSFDVADRAKLINDSRIRAVDDAKRKAMVYAEAAGIRLGDIINLQEESTGPQPRPTAARSGPLEAAGPARVPVEAGEVVLRVRVRITWRIAN